jgi:hypothetical protein
VSGRREMVVRGRARGGACGWLSWWGSVARSALALAVALMLLVPLGAGPQQEVPKLLVDDDCQAFAFDPSGTNVAYAIPHLKREKRLYIERDDVWIASGPSRKRIIEGEKFMPFPPPAGYVVNSMSWSPDGRRLAMDMILQQPPSGYEYATGKSKGKEEDVEDRSPVETVGGGKVVALIEDDGAEIKVAGSKDRFIQDAKQPAWLADNATVVYLGAGSNQIARVKPSDGQAQTLFDGHPFDAVVWDGPRNQAYAVGRGLRGQLTLMRLDLLNERITEVARLENYQGSLALSPSGKKIGFFEDGDNIVVIDLANPTHLRRVPAGFGRFEWSSDERRVLLKRGPLEKSNSLVWVTLQDGSFESALHDLTYHDFAISPDGKSLAVTQPGKRVLRVYPLP